MDKSKVCSVIDLQWMEWAEYFFLFHYFLRITENDKPSVRNNPKKFLRRNNCDGRLADNLPYKSKVIVL